MDPDHSKSRPLGASDRAEPVQPRRTALTAILVGLAALVLAGARLGGPALDDSEAALAARALEHADAGAGFAAGRASAETMPLAASLAGVLAFVSGAYVVAGVAVAGAILAGGPAGMLAPLAVVSWASLALRPRFLVAGRFWLAVALCAAAVTGWWAVWQSVAGEVAQSPWEQPLDWRGAAAALLSIDVLARRWTMASTTGSCGVLLWMAPLWPIALWLRLRSGARWDRHALVIALAVAAMLAPSSGVTAGGSLAFALALAVASGIALSAFAAVRSSSFAAALVGGVLVLSFVSAGGRGAAGMSIALPILLGALACGLWAAGGRGVRFAMMALWIVVVAAEAAATADPVGPANDVNADLRALGPRIRSAVPESATLLTDRPAIAPLVFYARRIVRPVADAFRRAGRFPDELYGVFESPLYRGIAGYAPTELERHGRETLVRFTRDPNEPVPPGPRLLVPESEERAATETLRLLGAEPWPIAKHAIVNEIVVRQAPAAGPALDRGAWRAEGGAQARAAIDGDPATAWQPGTVGGTLVVDLGRARRIAGVRLLAPDRSSVPADLRIDAAASEDEWSQVVRVGPFLPGFRLLPAGLEFTSERLVFAEFPPLLARWLRVSASGGRASAWRIAELDALGEP